MDMKQRLLEDLKIAMRNKEVLKKDLLQICRSEVLKIEKDKKTELDDAGVIDVLAKEYKKRADVIEELGDREDLKEKYNKEMEVIESYLPEQLTETELTKIVQLTITETGANSMRDMGKLMQAIMPKVRGRADGNKVNLIVRKLLGS